MTSDTRDLRRVTERGIHEADPVDGGGWPVDLCAFFLLDAKELGLGGRVNGGLVGAVDTGQFILRGGKIRLHRESVPERGDR